MVAVMVAGAGGWWLVAGGWWLVAGGWWLVAGAGDWWLHLHQWCSFSLLTT
jgi:hypothetical protein